jgi:hypothetical protein
MLRRQSSLKYVGEFREAPHDCYTYCEFWDFCGGAQAGNRYFEHGALNAMEKVSQGYSLGVSWDSRPGWDSWSKR